MEREECTLKMDLSSRGTSKTVKLRALELSYILMALSSLAISNSLNLKDMEPSSFLRMSSSIQADGLQVYRMERDNRFIQMAPISWGFSKMGKRMGWESTFGLMESFIEVISRATSSMAMAYYPRNN